jgi:hypothetical protein
MAQGTTARQPRAVAPARRDQTGVTVLGLTLGHGPVPGEQGPSRSDWITLSDPLRVACGATAVGVSCAGLHVTMITPSPRSWGAWPPRSTWSARQIRFRVDVCLSGAEKVLSYDRVSDGAVVVIRFQRGDWESKLLALGNEDSPQRADRVGVNRLGPGAFRRFPASPTLA